MSQSGSLSAANFVPSNVAQAYVTDSGTAIPALNILNVVGGGSITTSGSGDTLTITDNQSLQVIRGPIVDLTTLGTTDIYTFPDDFVVCGVKYTITSLTGVASGDAKVNIGFNSPDYDNIIEEETGLPQFLNFVSGQIIYNGAGPFTTLLSGQLVKINVTQIESGASVMTMRVDIIGYYYTSTGSGGSGNSTLTLTGDTGIPGQPVAGNWDIVGGTNISTVSSAGQLIINCPLVKIYFNGSTTTNLNDSTAYTMTTTGGFTSSGATGTLSNSFVVPFAGTLRRCTFFIRNTTSSSSETYDVNFRLNATTSYSIAGSTMTNDSNINYVTNANMNIPLVIGDFFNFIFTAPAFTINPTLCTGSYYLEIEV